MGESHQVRRLNGPQPRDPVVMRARNAVRGCLRAEAPDSSASSGGTAGDDTMGQAGPRPSPCVLVACSGGADSLALAAATAWAAPRQGWRAGAAIVDHGLLGDSAQVADRAAAQCRAMGMDPVLVGRVHVPLDSPEGVEAAARTARYAMLAELARAAMARLVLLGHTMDDQAETMVLALGRGSGLRALTGMSARPDPLFRRPFLTMRRQDTERICRFHDLTVWNDPTNVPGGPLPSRRAEVRAQVIPAAAHVLGPGFVPALARTAEDLRDVDELLDTLAAELYRQAKQVSHTFHAASSFILDSDTLAASAVAVRRRVLHQAALDWGAVPGDVTRSQVLALDALVVSYHGQGPVDLPGGLRIGKKYGRLEVLPVGT